MLTCFNLDSKTTIDEFQAGLAEFTGLMRDSELLHSTGPVGRRQRHPIMDTDSERNHQFFFIMTFTDRQQCDQAVAKILQHEDPSDIVHKAIYANITDPIFICWEDL